MTWPFYCFCSTKLQHKEGKVSLKEEEKVIEGKVRRHAMLVRQCSGSDLFPKCYYKDIESLVSLSPGFTNS